MKRCAGRIKQTSMPVSRQFWYDLFLPRISQPHPDTYTPFLARFSQLSFPRLGGDLGHVGGHSGVQIDGGKLGGEGGGPGHHVVVPRGLRLVVYRRS